MLRIAICDDSQDFLPQAAGMVRQWSEQCRIPIQLFLYKNGDELLSAAFSSPMDIVFLDIIMPLLNGMDTARELRQHDTSVSIIFLTSSPEFALESYEVHAQGYLLKPVTYEKLQKELDECAHSFQLEPKNMVVKTPFGYQKLYFHEIEYAEAQNKRVFFYLRNGSSVETMDPLYSFKENLNNQNGFFKCHRSYLVYLPNVDHFNTTEITMKSGRQIPIARGFSKSLKDAYFSVMFQE